MLPHLDPDSKTRPISSLFKHAPNHTKPCIPIMKPMSLPGAKTTTQLQGTLATTQKPRPPPSSPSGKMFSFRRSTPTIPKSLADSLKGVTPKLPPMNSELDKIQSLLDQISSEIYDRHYLPEISSSKINNNNINNNSTNTCSNSNNSNNSCSKDSSIDVANPSQPNLVPNPRINFVKNTPNLNNSKTIKNEDSSSINSGGNESDNENENKFGILCENVNVIKSNSYNNVINNNIITTSLNNINIPSPRSPHGSARNLKEKRSATPTRYNCEKVADSAIFKLFTILNQPRSVASLNEKIVMNIFNVIKKNIIISVPEIPSKFIFCDKIAKINLQNWEFFQYFHKVALILIRESDRKFLTGLLNQELVHSLVSVLNSPDSNEQTSIENLISAITERYEETKELFYIESISRIERHIFDEVNTSYFCVCSCMRFLHNYFRENLVEIASPTVFEFKIFPLFSSYFLSEFYEYLNPICSLFYGLFDNLPETSIKYLLSHWPETHTAKQVIFIQHISVIAPFLGSNSIKTYLEMIFGRLAKCLKSSNYKIISTTLQIISDATFIYLFSSYSETVIKAVYPPLIDLRGHWSNDVSNKIENAIGILKQMNSSFFQTIDIDKDVNDPANRKTQVMNESWMLIVGAASEAINDDEKVEFELKLKALSNTQKTENQCFKQTKMTEYQGETENDFNSENNENPEQSDAEENDVEKRSKNEIADEEEKMEKNERKYENENEVSQQENEECE
ncbi:hypothetical protein TRFO_22647 [Tritrichomonas foetus]|uniref:Phosphoprotein phosphatase n=1 Tax=Tritrichomonas foetus TaxID=1144522 RepID=A0A1J4KBK8_9EUKA|nr:hypothetical protein TRFO_22647 [Tritrichomonas foetus]|eukprot:OHT08793.1 hypothetical protein TRFO_22647 [Tritrichomonas foetus]